uniref:IncF plasmid conjugative transfer protein TraG n=1 Tax=Klebsiella pneumoniae TaxID=573 RepID=A0A8B0SX89_KLEPN|nr:IncF plasmid conjugative transfer protein TraG [Klebsiella pneumoniae]
MGESVMLEIYAIAGGDWLQGQPERDCGVYGDQHMVDYRKRCVSPSRYSLWRGTG